jgi:hypothetical protein
LVSGAVAPCGQERQGARGNNESDAHSGAFPFDSLATANTAKHDGSSFDLRLFGSLDQQFA